MLGVSGFILKKKLQLKEQGSMLDTWTQYAQFKGALDIWKSFHSSYWYGPGAACAKQKEQRLYHAREAASQLWAAGQGQSPLTMDYQHSPVTQWAKPAQ